MALTGDSLLYILLVVFISILLILLGLVFSLYFKLVHKQKLKLKSNQVNPVAVADVERGKDLLPMKYLVDLYEQQFTVQETQSYRAGFGTYRHVAIQLLEHLLHNLYNIRVKVECRDTPFRSSRELPLVSGTVAAEIQSDLMIRLDAGVAKDNQLHSKLTKSMSSILEAENVTSLHTAVTAAMDQAETVAKQSGLAGDSCGTVPYGQKGYFTATALNCSELVIEWEQNDVNATGIVAAAQKLLHTLRTEKRQLTQSEFLALQFAYHEMLTSNSAAELALGATWLGTPGFRRDTQTYMSLTDPGDGHVMGTTKRSDWMRGAIIHVEHLERPKHDPRNKIESYRIPSILDFCKVRLHVGDIAPTTSFMGRRVKDSDDGDFERDFVKIVHLTAAACSAMFQNGAAECKIAMEGLTTSQAVRYMRALAGQVIRSHKQLLSAAWNLNQTIVDDVTPRQNGYATSEQHDDVTSAKTMTLDTRMAIARRAIEVTCLGGFDKVTWDGASDTYPSQCIMYQLSEEDALSLVHGAHERGLLTYFSSGFKFAEIQLAIFSGVDGVGIGGAQVLRYMDKQSGMHGPYMEENITRILTARDTAAASTRGRGVHLLCRLDTMFFEGSITREENEKRLALFQALKAKNGEQIATLLNDLKHVMEMSHDGENPMLGTARRLLQAADTPLLKSSCNGEVQWQSLLGRLRVHLLQGNEDGVFEEYISSVWTCFREKYHREVCKIIPRHSTSLLKNKHFK